MRDQKMKMYYPIQPDYKTKNAYKEYVVKPADELYGVVLKFYEFSSSSLLEPVIVNSIPDAIIDLVFKFHPSYISSHIGGGPGTDYTFSYRLITGIFGMQLVPGAVNMLFPFSSEEVVESKRIRIDEIKEMAYVRRRMEETNSFEERMRLVSDFFSGLVKKNKNINNVIIDSVMIMMDNLGDIRIEEIADMTGYSIRYFRKMFKEYTGYSPQKFMRVVRFQKSYQMIKDMSNLNLTTIAMESGYYDQSHMNKEYMMLINKMPHDVRNEVA